MERFAKLPTWWVRSERSYFPGGRAAGTSLAGLKCLLVMSLTMDFHTQTTDVSFSTLEDMTGLSRPMVSRGVQHLETQELIEVTRSSYANSYRLLMAADDEGWGKLPYRKVKAELPHFLNRGTVPLEALKTYVAMLARRPNNATRFPLSYEAILSSTHGQRTHLRRALNLLVAQGLIACERPTDIRTQNVYTILGL